VEKGGVDLAVGGGQRRQQGYQAKPDAHSSEYTRNQRRREAAVNSRLAWRR
jgi:hypothetical protein